MNPVARKDVRRWIGGGTMLLLNRENRDRIGPATLALTREEAKELVETLTYLLQDEDYHHDHIEDYENKSLLDLVVIVPRLLPTYDAQLRVAIESISMGK